MSIISTVPKGAAVEGINPNLLDNWYFGNPVNQRGQSSYGAVGYTIDRWRIENSNPSLSIASNGVTFSSAFVGGQFLQKIESYKFVNGKTYTLSALCTLTSGNATIKLAGVDSPYPDFGVATVTTGLSSVTFTLNRGSYSGPIKAFIRNDSANGSVIIHAFKLELGTEQTLAHQEDGAWVLNEIPDYGEELRKCQTSTADSSDTYANKNLATGQELAYVENGTTATKTNGYAVGEYFCWHGLLYRAKTAIGNGDTFTENTNCEQVPGGGFNDITKPIDIKSECVVNNSVLIVDNLQVVLIGRVLIISGNTYRNVNGTNITVITLPSRLGNAKKAYFYVGSYDGGFAGEGYIVNQTVVMNISSSSNNGVFNVITTI